MSSDAPTSVHLRRMARTLWGLATLFTLYAATLPFSFVTSTFVIRDHLAQAMARSALSEVRVLSRADVLQNILLFVPFGLFAVASFARVRPVSVLVTAGVTAAVLSLTCEVLQLMTVDRVSSVWDLYANVCGALLGGMTAVVVRDLSAMAGSRRQVRGLLSESTLPVLAAVLLVCTAAWEPFDVTLDVGTVWAKIRPFVNNTWTYWHPITDEPLTALRFGMLTLLTVSAMQQSGLALRRARPLGALAVILGAVLLELSQFLITSRSASLQDLTAATAGTLLGAALSRWPSGLEQRVAALVVLTVVAAAPFYLQPFALAAQYQSMALVPFLAYYQFTTLQTVSHVIELVLIYAPIGFAVQRDRREALASRRILLLTIFVASLLEFAQGSIAGRYPDVTDVGMAALGGLMGAAVARYGSAWINGVIGGNASRTRRL